MADVVGLTSERLAVGAVIESQPYTLTPMYAALKQDDSIGARQARSVVAARPLLSTPRHRLQGGAETGAAFEPSLI